MMLPAQDYRATQITVPPKLHTGLDRTAHAALGLYNRRAGIVESMHREAVRVVDESLGFRNLSERKLRERLRHIGSQYRRQKKGHEALLSEALVLMAEVSERMIGLRPHPVQVLGAMALHRGHLVEMATGEGKSLTACFPAVLAAWTGRPCHIVTVNDYLAGRDADIMRPFYSLCGVSVGWVGSTMGPAERQQNYTKGVVYTTSKELLADFLRDRIKMGQCQHPERRLLRAIRSHNVIDQDGLVMRGLHTAIVDEADSVLIDEAVTPLIISHPRANALLKDACHRSHDIAGSLSSGDDYHVDYQYREITLTAQGREKIEILASSLPGLWKGPSRREELIIQALTAREFYHRDQQYVIQDDKVVIVDEFTGRLMQNRTWKHGLHQAVEACEGLELTDPGETLARLSFQRFFRFFNKLSGMTGTAGEAASEFWHIYGLPVMTIPTNRPCIRNMMPDSVLPDEQTKWNAVIEAILQIHNIGRPVLAGTRSIRASERLSEMLASRGLPFRLLNAVRHEEEAVIVAKAGEGGAITIATNMAGRGTDIKLGKGVSELGGLHVIATERHESGRIDRQLFGRCARQGDPGSAQAFISTEDELVRRFMPAPMQKVLSAAIEKKIPGAQKITERSLSFAQNAAQRLSFRQRKNVLQMDSWLSETLSFTGTDIET